jgi:hypothetical protein
MAEFIPIPEAPTDEGSDGHTVSIRSAQKEYVGAFYWDQRYSAITVPGALDFFDLPSELETCLVAISQWPSNVRATLAESDGDMEVFHLAKGTPSPPDFLRAIGDPSRIDFVRFDVEIEDLLSTAVPFSIASENSTYPDAELTVRIPAGVDWTQKLLSWVSRHVADRSQIEASLFADLNRLKLRGQRVGESW